MDLQLKGKCALVTGGSEGIGKAIAMTLAKEGVNVAICARRQEPLEKTAEEIRNAYGVTVVAITADLTKDAEAKNFVEKAAKELGSLDLMINNAGSAPGGVIETLTEADWEQAMQLKFMGYVRCLRYALPIMVKQGGGRVVNLIGNDGVKPSYWEIAPGAAGRPVRPPQHLVLRRQSGAGAHRTLGRPRRRHVARHGHFLRRGRQAGAGLHPARPHRRGRGSRQPRRHAGIAAGADGQRHDDRDRWRSGQGANGSLSRPVGFARRGSFLPLPLWERVDRTAKRFERCALHRFIRADQICGDLLGMLHEDQS
jgi:NADP-dependent 3-hydroxy acid dehydrogenase YdfG